MPLPTPIGYADQLAQALGVQDDSSKAYLAPDRNQLRVDVVAARSQRNFPGMGPSEVNAYMEPYVRNRDMVSALEARSVEMGGWKERSSSHLFLPSSFFLLVLRSRRSAFSPVPYEM